MQKMSVIKEIREHISGEIFSYLQLMEALNQYKKPRDVVTRLTRNGDIVRIKKGLYVFGEIWRKENIYPEQIANLIYGPSCVSLEYVLSNAGIIPEKVKTITSVTTGRSRTFRTPVGLFSYSQISRERFSPGIKIERYNGVSYMIAEPLKALIDKIWLDRRFHPTSPSSYSTYLFDDLRVDEDSLKKILMPDKLEFYNKVYASRKINWFVKFAKRELMSDE